MIKTCCPASSTLARAIACDPKRSRIASSASVAASQPGASGAASSRRVPIAFIRVLVGTSLLADHNSPVVRPNQGSSALCMVAPTLHDQGQTPTVLEDQ
jgi:hypothetical protein